jgi:Xaa-Pro dipeptidase
MNENLLTPKSEIDSRIIRQQKALSDSNADAAIILQNADLFYFTGTLAQGFLYISKVDEPIFFIRKNFERAIIESRIGKKLKIKSLREGFKSLAEVINKGTLKIGLELDVLPVNQYFLIKEIFSNSSLVDISGAIKKFRMIKSEFEVLQIRNAANIAVSVIKKIPSFIEIGMTENDLSARIEYELRKLGHQGLVRARNFNMEFHFGPVISGESANYPTFFDGPVGAKGLYPAITSGASRKKIVSNEPIVVDFVAGYNGYLSDITRIFGIGNLPREILKTHDFVIHDLLPTCENMIKPGFDAKEIYRASLGIAQKAGFSENFMGFGSNKVRFLGHGLGLELDEEPVICDRSIILEPGMVFALEPKIFIKGLGGCGVENTYVVTDKGFEKLTFLEEEVFLV